MTDTTTSDAGGKEAFKKDWGIPFGRPGNAVDYAQCVISTITVSFWSRLLLLVSRRMPNGVSCEYGADLVCDWMGCCRTNM
jgi:hypothetical protein